MTETRHAPDPLLHPRHLLRRYHSRVGPSHAPRLGIQSVDAALQQFNAQFWCALAHTSRMGISGYGGEN